MNEDEASIQVRFAKGGQMISGARNLGDQWRDETGDYTATEGPKGRKQSAGLRERKKKGSLTWMAGVEAWDGKAVIERWKRFPRVRAG